MQDVLVQPKVKVPFLQRHYQSLAALSLLLADLSGIALAFFLGFRLRLLIPIPDRASGDLYFVELVPLMILQALSIVVAFFFGRMYHRRRTRFSADDLVTTFSGVSIGTLVSIAIASLSFKSGSAAFDYSRGLMIYAWLLAMLFVMAFRGVLARLQLWLQSRGYGQTRLVIVGSGLPASSVIQRISQNARLGYDLVGLVGPAPIGGARLLGDIDLLPAVIVRQNIDEVIIAMPDATDQDMMRITSMCDRSTMSIKVYPGMFQMMAGQMSIGELGGLPLLNVRDVALRGWKLTLKRGIDLLGSAFGLVFLSPFMMLMAALIKLDSPGPVFFCQERMGLDGKRFYMIKFRSMRQDAERTGPGWTTHDDPRKTRLGSLIRRTSIDELPQLINVLLGEMSLVGPRPERPVYVDQFRQRIPRYMERHREKAGMTGWAQVNGMRGDTSIEERTQYDLWYIENWSVWLDIKIILKQVALILLGTDRNAY